MPIALDHLLIPPRDRRAAAERLNAILGVPWAAPVQHCAFRVSDAEFDALLERLQALGVPRRSLPHGPDDGRVNTSVGGRIVYWREPDGHVWEALTQSYARAPRAGE
jgi:catechol 2,3-dioxygenase-like lactoylglutathione lyase family enzyme